MKYEDRRKWRAKIREGSRGMEHRINMTDIKTARTCGESFPFLSTNIQRLVMGGKKETVRMTLFKRTEREHF